MLHTVITQGIETWPDINLRDNPGRIGTFIHSRVPKGLQATCSETHPDPQGDSLGGQIYQWFFLTFPDGIQGWVRDDLILLEGDCTTFGYGFYETPILAFDAKSQLADFDDQTHTFIESTVCHATIRPDINANVRAGSTIQSARLGLLIANTQVDVLAVVDGQDDDTFRWIKMRSGDISGFIREDLLVYENECESLGLSIEPEVLHPAEGTVNTEYRFDAPLRANYGISQEFGGIHKGIDLFANLGVGVYSGGLGRVAYTMNCLPCTPACPNVRCHNISLNNPSVLRNPDWGYGFGNHVVVEYAWNNLPQAMRDNLLAENLPNAFVYVIYAHLLDVLVAPDELVTKGKRLGSLGNSGNSTGPHLHIEVRASQLKISTNDTTGIFQRFLVAPRHMFAIN